METFQVIYRLGRRDEGCEQTSKVKQKITCYQFISVTSLIVVTNPWQNHLKGRRASLGSISECHGREGRAMLVMARAHGGDQESDSVDLNQKQTFKYCPERPQEALLIAGSAFQRFHILPKRVPTAGDRVFKCMVLKQKTRIKLINKHQSPWKTFHIHILRPSLRRLMPHGML